MKKKRRPRVRKEGNDKNLTLVGHLTELRKRILVMGLLFLSCSLLAYQFSEVFIRQLIQLVPEVSFVFISPAELLMATIKLAFLSGFVLSSPLIFMEVWLFLRPALKKSERGAIGGAFLFGTVFFVLGAVFSYHVVLPLMIRFFLSFEMEGIEAMISFQSYLTLVVNTMVSFGLVFELPSVMVILTRLHMVTPKLLKKYRKYCILVMFVLVAVLTPPDIISQCMLALPMLLLFELGIVLSSLTVKKQKKKEVYAP